MINQHQIRIIIFYGYQLRMSLRETAKKINRALGKDIVTDLTVLNWFQCFNDGDTSLEDCSHHGRPSSLGKDALRYELELHLDISTRILEKTLERHNRIIDRHLQSMGYRRFLSRWKPQLLTYHDRAVRVSIDERLLRHPCRKNFLNLIVIGDESWV